MISREKVSKSSELISIIVPVYNCEKYLDECIKSLLCQTYKDIEIILVDDGSTDMSSQICDGYVGFDSRVKVIHQPNSGVSAARNAGISMSSGDFITFVDADDYIADTYCEMLFSQVEEETDLVIGRTIAFNNGGEIDDGYKGKSVEIFKTQTDKNNLYRAIFIDNPLINHYPHISTCSAKLFRKSVLTENDISYDTSLKVYEDAVFNTRVIEASHEVKLINKKIYFYRFNPVSGSNRFTSAIFDQYDSVYDFYEKFDSKNGCGFGLYKDYFIVKNLNTVLVNFFRSGHDLKMYKSLLEDIKRRGYYREAINNVKIDTLPKRRKLMVFCFKHKFDVLLYLAYSILK